MTEKNLKLTQSDFYVKNLSTPASLRSDRGWPVSIGTSGRFRSEQPAGFSGISIMSDRLALREEITIESCSTIAVTLMKK